MGWLLTGFLMGTLFSMAVPILMLKIVTDRLYKSLNELAELFINI